MPLIILISMLELTTRRSPARRLLARPVQRPVSRPYDFADAQDRPQRLIHGSIRREGLGPDDIIYETCRSRGLTLITLGKR